MLIDILRIIFFLAIAVPFLYMMIDVSLDLGRRTLRFYHRKAKPVVNHLITSISQLS